MMKRIATAALIFAVTSASAQTTTPSAFEVATVKAVDPDAKSSRLLQMDSNNHFIAKNFTVKLLIAAAYDLNPRTISGGPGWIETDKFDIQATTPGDTRPDHDAQMLMLRGLLTDRFGLAFHRQAKDFLIYEITVAKDGPKMKPTAVPNTDPRVVTTVYPDKLVMPARNATVSDLARLMQRAMLDRPVVDNTGLTARYDFELTWSPDETQFGGEIPPMPDSQAPPLLVAMQQQLGLVMKSTHGPVQAMVIDKAEKPTEN